MTDTELEAVIKACQVPCPCCYGDAGVQRGVSTGGLPADFSSYKCPNCRSTGRILPDPVERLIEEVRRLQAERDAGAKFKAFVHSYLSEHGVPEGDPENQHQKEGCRIGARLDLLFAQRDRLRTALLRWYTLRQTLSSDSRQLLGISGQDTGRWGEELARRCEPLRDFCASLFTSEEIVAEIDRLTASQELKP